MRFFGGCRTDEGAPVLDGAQPPLRAPVRIERSVLRGPLDAVVIGAGVVGLAVARALALAGREVVILEAEDAIGTHTSSRNSEVIHAGIYYPKGSLKARTCVEGRSAFTTIAPSTACRTGAAAS